MPTPLHRIRLKGPWEALGPGAEHDQWTRIHVPIAWRDCFGMVPGTARFRRNFHQPTGIETGERVGIRLPIGIGTVQQVSVNGTVLTPFSGDETLLDATPHLESFNTLECEIHFDPGNSPEIPGGLWEAVWIEIFSNSE